MPCSPQIEASAAKITGYSALSRSMFFGQICMAFFDKLVEHESAFHHDIALYRDTAPFVLYGAKVMADRIYRYLDKIGIEVDIVAVDDEYFKEGELFHNIPIISITSITEDVHCHYNYIIAFTGYSQNKNKALNNNANHIFFYDIATCLDYEDDNVTVQFDFYKKYRKNLEWVSASLRDELSREILIAHINQRVSGKFEYKRPFFSTNQYFPDIMPLDAGEAFVDCGAYTGDTVTRLLQNATKRTSGFRGSIYAFEPDIRNFCVLAKNTAEVANCRLWNKGVWKNSGTLAFLSKFHRTDSAVRSAVKDNCYDIFSERTQIDVVSLDEVLSNSNVTFIKMDIEGSELSALQGARNIIGELRPKLAICIYHKNSDIFEIQQYIYQICPDYKFYIRSHSYYSTELVLYAL
jgi:FkbM family methyltransferase